MARPLRRLYPLQRMTRRRHRTWMVSMTLGTGAIAVWGIAVVGLRIEPSWVPDFWVVFALASLFAVPGLLLGLWTIRSKFAWLMFALVPVCLNGMLIVMPLLVRRLRDTGA